MQPRLALYVTPMCGYCHYVMSIIQELNLDVEIHNIMADRNHLQELFKARNRTTVPVLKITSSDDVQWMPESRVIVQYLQGMKADL